MALNDRQKAFVLEYLIDSNATQAAIRAGYSKKTARSQGQRLLTHVDIKRKLASLKQKRADRLEITADRVHLELARVAFGRLDEVLTFGPAGVVMRESEDMSEDALAAISEVSEGKDGEMRVKMHGKVQALQTLGRFMGLDEAKKDDVDWEQDAEGLDALEAELDKADGKTTEV